MATTQTIVKNVVTAVLDTGQTTASGAAKVANVNLPTLKTRTLSNDDLDLLMNVVDALAPCFEYSYVQTKMTVTSELRMS